MSLLGVDSYRTKNKGNVLALGKPAIRVIELLRDPRKLKNSEKCRRCMLSGKGSCMDNEVCQALLADVMGYAPQNLKEIIKTLSELKLVKVRDIGACGPRPRKYISLSKRGLSLYLVLHE